MVGWFGGSERRLPGAAGWLWWRARGCEVAVCGVRTGLCWRYGVGYGDRWKGYAGSCRVGGGLCRWRGGAGSWSGKTVMGETRGDLGNPTKSRQGKEYELPI